MMMLLQRIISTLGVLYYLNAVATGHKKGSLLYPEIIKLHAYEMVS